MTHALGLIFASAFTLSLYDICKKHSVSGNRAFTVLCLTSGTGFLSVTLALALTGRLAATLALDFRSVALLLLKSVIVGASWSLAYWALKTMPVTVMAPIRATGPVWTTLAAIAVFAEVPSLRQAVGFLLAFAGCVGFSWTARREGFCLRSRAILLAIGATLFGSLSALYDKCLLNRLGLPPETVLFWFMGGMTVIYLIAVVAVRRLDATPFTFRATIPAVGILLAVSDFLYFSAVATPDARISILSTLRRLSTVGTFLLGGALFHERNLVRKALALAAILAGVAFLCLKNF